MRDEETIVRRYGTRKPDETDDATARRIASAYFGDDFRRAWVAHDDNGRVEVEAVVPLLFGRYVLQRDPPGSDTPTRLLPLRSVVAMAAYAAEVDADGRPCEEQ